MHPASLAHMARLRRHHLAYLSRLPEPKICDDGGFCNSPAKSYRTIFADLPGLQYHSCDIVAHASVQHVKPDPFTLPFPDEHFDLVVSGQMLEHCQNPFRAVAEMKRVLKVGSCLAIIVPSTGPYHDVQDGWRFMGDAFKFIRREVGGLKSIVDFVDPSNDEESRAGKWHDHVWLAQRV